MIPRLCEVEIFLQSFLSLYGLYFEYLELKRKYLKHKILDKYWFHIPNNYPGRDINGGLAFCYFPYHNCAPRSALSVTVRVFVMSAVYFWRTWVNIVSLKSFSFQFFVLFVSFKFLIANAISILRDHKIIFIFYYLVWLIVS